MKRRALALAALLLGWSLLNVPVAFGQSVVYPDEPGYEEFRLSEQDTLEALHKDPSRSLAFRLLVTQRRLREAQLMIAKEKLYLVPGLLKDYREAIKGIKAFLQTLTPGPRESAGYSQSIEAARLRHQEILKHLARRVPPDLHPSIEAALASSEQLRHLTTGSPFGGAGSSRAGLTRKHRAAIQEPVAPEGTALEEGQLAPPPFPEGTPRDEILQPAETPRPLTPDEVLGHRLRPSETHTRGTRRPGDTHPRPRAREPIRRRDR